MDYSENERLPGKEIEAWVGLIQPAQRTSVDKYVDADGQLKAKNLKYKEMYHSDLMKAWMNSRERDLIEEGLFVAREFQKLDMLIGEKKVPVFNAYDKPMILTDFSEWLKELSFNGKSLNEDHHIFFSNLFFMWLNEFEKKQVGIKQPDFTPSINTIVDECYTLAIISAGRDGNAAKNVRTERTYSEAFSRAEEISQDQMEKPKKPTLIDKFLGSKPKQPTKI